MPGPVGGGRSGGGGIGGGASHGGGFSGGARSSFSGSSHSHLGGFHHMNANNNDPEQEKKNKGKGIIIFFIFIAVMFGGQAVSLFEGIFSHFDATPDLWAEFETVMVESVDWGEEPVFEIDSAPRAKLDESLCKPVDVWYLDMAQLFEPYGEGETVEHALSYFYEKTGVQPLLVTANYIDGTNAPSWDAVENYLYNLYVDLFGEDEGHYIFLYFQHSDDSYTLYYIPGWDAMEVMDDTTSAILMDYVEWYYHESSTYGEMFASAFADAADEIMYAEMDTSVDLTDAQEAVLSTAPPASTVPAVEADSSVELTVPVVELTSEPESVEITYHEVITYYEEPDSELIWEENVTEYTDEPFVSADVIPYLSGAAVIVLAVVLFVVFLLWQKKKMRDLEEDM